VLHNRGHAIAGGADKMEEKMQVAYENEKFQWALKLAEALLDTQKKVSSAKTTKINSLRQLALSEVSSCGRNWYLTEAMVEEGLVLKPTQKQIKNRIHTGTLYDLFLLLTVMVDLDKTADVIETACFHFTDVDLHFVLKLRRGVMELLPSMEGEEETKFDLEVTTTDTAWRGIMAKEKSPAMAVLKHDLEIKPRLKRLQTFMSYFDTDN